jgi:stage V sporulation protein SpoVS
MIANVTGHSVIVFTPNSTKELKTGSLTDTNKLASVIESSFGDGEDQVIRQIGAGALNVSVKGVATARLALIQPKMSIVKDVLVRPVWVNALDNSGKEVSTIELQTVFILDSGDTGNSDD